MAIYTVIARQSWYVDYILNGKRMNGYLYRGCGTIMPLLQDKWQTEQEEISNESL